MPYKDPERQREYQRQWMKRRRGEFLDGKVCVLCGGTDALEVHHLDPFAKDDHKIWSWTKKRRDAELAKCVVLCGRCHDQHHANVAKNAAEARNEHGDVRRYWNGCRCSLCRRAHSAYNKLHPSKRAA